MAYLTSTLDAARDDSYGNAEGVAGGYSAGVSVPFLHPGVHSVSQLINAGLAKQTTRSLAFMVKKKEV